MKYLFTATLIATLCFAGSAVADTTYRCEGQNQVAHLKITEPTVQNGSYDECNGGVGDEMTDCRTHDYQIQVRNVVVTLKVNDEPIHRKMQISGSGNTLSGFDMFAFNGNAIHLRLTGDMNNPVLNLKFLARGTPGNPVEVGNYLLSCK